MTKIAHIDLIQCLIRMTAIKAKDNVITVYQEEGEPVIFRFKNDRHFLNTYKKMHRMLKEGVGADE